MARLQNKVALITGGASGLGRGIAQRYCEEGAVTFISDVNDDLGASVAAKLGATYISQDVADEDRWQDVIRHITDAAGRLDILVNNAGIFTSCPVDETPLEQWQQVMNVNLTGVFLGCKHGIRAMKANPGGPAGSIINLSSVVGLRKAATTLPFLERLRVLCELLSLLSSHPNNNAKLSYRVTRLELYGSTVFHNLRQTNALDSAVSNSKPALE